MQLTDVPKVLLNCQNVLGESILWDDRTEQLWWTNIHAREVWCWTPDETSSPRIYHTEQRVGAIGLCEGTGLALALEKGFGLLDPESGEIEWCVDVESDIPHTRLNDGRVDPAGRFLSGGMHEGSPQLPKSALWRWEGSNQVSKCIPHISCANSLCWSPDGRTMYFADMPEGTIKAYPYNLRTGEVGEARLFADLTEQPGLADGSVVDEEGYLWNAQWGGARIVRYSPDGVIDRIVSLPVANPTCLTFGGKNLDVLFVTTAWWGLTVEQRHHQPLAGNLFAFKPGVRGQREHRFMR